eukprot:3631416-Pleurochrysis_carterae.AAC.1
MHYASSWWPDFTNSWWAMRARISRKLSLKAGERYWLETACWEFSGADHCSVGVRFHGTDLVNFDPDPRARQHPNAAHEKQRVELHKQDAQHEARRSVL